MPNNPISSWYNSQYRVWDRTRRLQMAPFLAQAERNVAPVPVPPADAVAIDMSNVVPAGKESHSEALFGPPIPLDAAHDANQQNALPRDEVSQTVVDGWVERNKQGHESATTLQALVNLKRPSLRLTPLSSNASNPDLVSTVNTKTSHGLEFEYDCDAAKCRIVVTIAPTPTPPSAAPTSRNPTEPSEESTVIFESTTDGGFGHMLKHEHGAILDLEHHDKDKEIDTSAVEDAPPAEPESVAVNIEPVAARSRRRISVPFHIRRRSRVPQQAVGPALAVVDADVHQVVEGSSKDHAPKETGGVHVNIHLEALDENGEPLSSRNSQTTLLHVVKIGAPPADGAEDTRSWVVRVLKREAAIGTHTFRLHDIYGLASSTQPTAPSYPPAPHSSTDDDQPDAHTQQQTYDFAGAECVLCLSSPREVVLLPCRHLVACKECAENMVTFGAGEGVTHSEGDGTTGTGTGANGAGTVTGIGGTGGTAGSGAAVPEPLTPFQAAAAAGRRKRKAKGWFCPVCRQPYTALLRISAQTPNSKPDETSSVADAPAQQDESNVATSAEQTQAKDH